MLPSINDKQQNLNNGFTLTEILIVVALLGIIAAVVVPGFSSNDKNIVNIASNEVVQAIRYARNESIRTNISYGVSFDIVNKHLRVYWLDTSGTPTAVYDIRHPVDKNLYQVNFESDTYPATLSSVYIKYAVAPAQNSIGFAATTGTPQYNNAGTIRLLDTATIKVTYQSEERTVSITPMTGRVTVQ